MIPIPRRTLGTAALALATALGATAFTNTVVTDTAPTAAAVTGGTTVTDRPASSLQIDMGTGACSAVLLDDGWVATASHCVDDVAQRATTATTATTTAAGVTPATNVVRSTVGTTTGVYAITWADRDVALVRTAENLTGVAGPGVRLAQTAPTPQSTVTVRGWAHQAVWAGTPQQVSTRVLAPGEYAHNFAPIGAQVSVQTHGAGRIHAGDSGGAMLNEAGELVAVLAYGDVAENAIYGSGADLTGFASFHQARRDFAHVDTVAQARGLVAGGGAGVGAQVHDLIDATNNPDSHSGDGTGGHAQPGSSHLPGDLALSDLVPEVANLLPALPAVPTLTGLSSV